MKANETTSLDHENLFRLLQEMNLTVAARKVRELLARAQTHQLSYSKFLLDLLGEESQGRYERKLARGLKLSRLGNVKSLEEFDFSVRNKLSAAVVKELLTCQWIEEGRSIICIGRSGTGKSHIAKALGYSACMKGLSVYYGSVAGILDDLHASLADHTYSRLFRHYSRIDLLIAEDISYPGLDQSRADYLFRLVCSRHPARSMIVTANTGFENWGQFFPNQAQGIATVDRLIDRATILRFTGKSFRKPHEIYGDSLEEDGK